MDQKNNHIRTRPALRHGEYTVGWICALHHELTAAIAMLDEEHEELATTDDNHYILGRIGKHNVAIACLPEGHYGTTRATRVLSDLRTTFPSVRRCLLVGIGAGFPRPRVDDVRLGDIIVGRKVVPYDEGRLTTDGHFQRTGDNRRPSQNMLTALSIMRARQEDVETSRIIANTVQSRLKLRLGFQHPGADDVLFSSDYPHPLAVPDCRHCRKRKTVSRIARPTNLPQVHYGTIVSGNTLLRDAQARDQLAKDLDAIGAEMEAAGVLDIMPTLVVRGVSDYADSHKNDLFQKYAAANAAAFAREYLKYLKPDAIPTSASLEQPMIPRPIVGPSTEIVNRRKQILSSLQFDSMNARLFDIKGRLHSTCHWLLEDRVYLSWLDDSQLSKHTGFMWLKGKPGAGKSTVVRFLYEEHKNRLQQCSTSVARPALLASFFFHARGEELQKTIMGMYRSLVFQMFDGYPDLQHLLDDKELLPLTMVDCPSLSQLQELLQRGIAHLGSRQFICYIDALDECQVKEVTFMVRAFQDLAEEHNQQGAHFRVFFSSRHYPHIEPQIGIQLKLDFLDGHIDDIRKCVRARFIVKNDPLAEKIVRRSQGVFIWAVLVVDILNDHQSDGRPWSTAEEKLEQLPDDLNALFGEILRRHGSRMDEFIITVTWILFAKRPLSPHELEDAVWSDSLLSDSKAPLGVQEPFSLDAERVRRRIIGLSKGLAEVIQGGGYPKSTVQFIHESVRAFFLQHEGLARLWPEAASGIVFLSHERLKRCCYGYLTSPLVDARGSRSWALSRGSFGLYSTENVLYHADVAASQVDQRQFLSDLSRSPCLDKIDDRMVQESRKEQRLLYVLAERDCAQLIRILGEPLSWDCCASGGLGSPLLAALAGGHTAAVSALLKIPIHLCSKASLLNGPSDDSMSRPGRGQSLVSWAVGGLHSNLVRVLVDQGAPGDDLDPEGYTPLARAILISPHGPHRDSTISALLPSCRTVHWHGKIGVQFPISLADWISRNGEGEDVLSMILQSQIPIDKDILLRTATFGGHLNIAKLLLDHGADVNISNLLLDHGEDVNSSWSGLDQPLTTALRIHFYELAEHLILRGADIWAGGRWCDSAFRLAIVKNDTPALDWLIRKTSEDWHLRYGSEPILTAVKQGSVSLVERLLEHGADPNARGHWGLTCLMKVCSVPLALGDTHDERGEQIARLLVRHGADVNHTTINGKTALMYATESGNPTLVKYLLSQGADADLRMTNGLTARWLAKRHHPGVAQQILGLLEQAAASAGSS